MDNGKILTCVYCGHQYPQETPAHGSQVLTDHIKACIKHPMRKAETDIAMLRSALVGLVGADSKHELEQMEAAMRVLTAPEADKAASINAIHALLATLPQAKTQPTYQQRVIDEKAEIDQRATALSTFIGENPIFETVAPDEQERMREQCELMWSLSEVLGKRISAFNS